MGRARSRRLLAIAPAATSVLLATGDAAAAKLDVVGLFPGKVLVSVDGAAPRSLAVGDSVAGFRLVGVSGDAATFVVDGRRETVPMGSYVAGGRANARATAVLALDARGHFVAQGAINGSPTRFLVDTGATIVVLSRQEAERLGIDLRRASQGMANTANGSVAYRLVKLDRVRVGDLELTNVDAGVLDGYEGPNLLGMSFLSRTEVSRDGESMVLTRRY